MKIVKSLILALLMGMPFTLVFGAIFMDEWQMVFMHGFDDFLGFSLLMGYFVIWIYRKLYLTGVVNDIALNASVGAGDLAKIFKTKLDSSNNKKPNEKQTKLVKSISLTGVANVVFKPIIMAPTGCQVHGAILKGIGQWEVHYSVPSLNGSQKTLFHKILLALRMVNIGLKLNGQIHLLKHGKNSIGSF